MNDMKKRWYLRRVRHELINLPPVQRSTILADVESHIDDITDGGASIDSALERLGSACTLADTARAELTPDSASSRVPVIVALTLGAVTALVFACAAPFWNADARDATGAVTVVQSSEPGTGLLGAIPTVVALAALVVRPLPGPHNRDRARGLSHRGYRRHAPGLQHRDPRHLYARHVVARWAFRHPGDGRPVDVPSNDKVRSTRMTSKMMQTAGIASLVLVLAGCTAAAPEGPDWSRYPAHANVPADTVIDAASETEIIERGEQVLEKVRDELSERYGIPTWDERFEATWQPFDGNGYGGESLLSAYTARTWEAPIKIPKSEWDDVVELVEEIAEHNGLTAISSEGEAASEWMRHGSFTDDLFYIAVVVQDARLNDEELKVAEAEDLLISGIALSSGGTTVRDLDWKKFTERAEDFEGLEMPPATSD